MATLTFTLAIIITFLVILSQMYVIFKVEERRSVAVAKAEIQRQSEQRFRSLVQNSSDIITILDADGTIRYQSHSVERILGYLPTELIGKNALDYVHPDDIAIVRRTFTTALKHPGTLVTVEYRYRHANGFWVELESLRRNLLEDDSIRGIVCNARNITERKQAERKYRNIFENVVEGIFQTTLEGRYLTVNPMLARIYGYNSAAELMATIIDIEHQLYVEPNRRFQFQQLLQQEDAVWGFESQVYRKDGSIIWISESARVIRDAQGQLLGYEGIVEDITQRKQAEAELLQRDSLLEGVAAAMNHLLTHHQYDTAIANALTALGMATNVDRVYIYEPQFCLGIDEKSMSIRFEWMREVAALSEEGESDRANPPYWPYLIGRASALSDWYNILAAGGSISGSLRDFSEAEREILQHCGITSLLIVPIRVDHQFWGYIGFDNYQTERKWSEAEASILMAMATSIGGALQRQRAEAKIRYQAFHDLLTDLPNRTLLNDRMILALDEAAQNNGQLAIMLIDLDRFKAINDTLGHAVGDRLLITATQRLKGCLRAGDTLARWGGDEFTLLLPQIHSLEDALKVAERMVNALKPAFELDGHQLYITSSIGIAVYPQDGTDIQTLFKNADAALYRAKAEGRNNYKVYAPEQKIEV